MFFNTNDFSNQKVSMDHIKEWANEISGSYFNADEAPTSTLTKIAQSEDLTPSQVETLAAEANKLIHQHKYANIDDKYFAAEFPLADAKTAISALQLDGGETKIAAEFSEPVVEDSGPDAYEMFGIKPETIDKTASVKQQLKVGSEKTALLEQKLSDKILMTKSAVGNAEVQFIKQARQMALDQDSSLERFKVIGLVNHFIKSAGMDIGTKALAKLAVLLKKEGKLEPIHANKAVAYLMKEADEKAPQEWISDNLPCKVVNGNHPLYITLKTFHNRSKDLDDYSGKHNIVEDKLNIIRQRIRAL